MDIKTEKTFLRNEILPPVYKVLLGDTNLNLPPDPN